jgi:phosphonoacetaldehyde hydrolase
MKLEAVIFDWAGTLADYGCQAPVEAVVEACARHGVAVTRETARGPMGLAKKEHLRRVLPPEADLEAVYETFVPLQMDTIARHTGLIPGVAALAGRLRRRGLKIGTTTGYTREMLALLAMSAAQQGFTADAMLTPEEGGRPLPWMIWSLLLGFRVSAAAAAVKIGDTASDIEEGRNAGVWTVAVARTGNETGRTEAELAALPAGEREALVTGARNRLAAAGAHYVIESAADCEWVLEEIDARLARGERP